jgi:hypothetical protein
LGGEGGNPFTKKFKFFKKQNNLKIKLCIYIYEEIKEGKKNAEKIFKKVN